MAGMMGGHGHSGQGQLPSLHAAGPLNMFGHGGHGHHGHGLGSRPAPGLREGLDTALAIVEAVKDLASHNAELHMRIAHDEHDLAGHDGHHGG